MSLVVVGLHVILDLEKAFPDVRQEFVALKKLLFERCTPSDTWLVGHQCRGITAIDHSEWCSLQHQLIGGVVAVLGPR